MKQKIMLILLLLIGFLIPGGTQVIAQQIVDRPVISIDYYGAATTPARGEDFTMTVIFLNSGQQPSYNLMIEFVPGDLIPRESGGRQTIYQLIQGETKGLSQTFTVNPDLWSAQIANLVININYSDPDGNLYSDSFNLAVDLSVPAYGVPSPTPTPTPAVMLQPQLVIQSFSTDESILQPGTIFELSLNLTNLGNATAKSVSMVLGGGTVETNPEGTPQPGISGSAFLPRSNHPISSTLGTFSPEKPSTPPSASSSMSAPHPVLTHWITHLCI